MATLNTIALIGSYVPRRCGIATFTKDLRDALASEARANTFVFAMDDRSEGYSYPEEVRFQLQAGSLKDYQLAADLLNINQVDLVVLQHEYGIFGGHAGENILALVRRLRMPVVTYLHTVLTEPSRGQLAVMKELAAHSDRLVVMCDRAIRIMTDVYGVPEGKLVMIPHGIPDVPFTDSAFFKDQYGFEGRTILFTFGLLSPSKGIETVIRAMPAIAAVHADVAFVVAGAIHPHVFRHEGNAYLTSLKLLATKLGVARHVIFDNRYLTIEELCGYLGAADVYIASYPNKAQIVSGALSYAMGCGKACVATPFWYAEEVLAENRGRLFPAGDSEELARVTLDLLSDPVELAAVRKRAYLFSRRMVWKSVARMCLRAGQDAIKERDQHPHPLFHATDKPAEAVGLPDIKMDHMRTLTDDTGIFQHAIYAIPDRKHGYCVDDNARALLVALSSYDLSGDPAMLPLARTYLSFLHSAYVEETRRFRNFLSYDRRWHEEEGSDDAQGRAIWAIGEAVANAPDEGMLAAAGRLFCSAIEGMSRVKSPRAWAFALVGAHAYLRRFSGDSFVRRKRGALAKQLHSLFEKNRAPDWPWCEDTLTYSNGKLPHALILSGQWIPDRRMLADGLDVLEWLVKNQITADGRACLIGNQGWMTRQGHRARFDQQPVDAMALVEACAEAFRCTRKEEWKNRADVFLSWFLGNNETESPLYDASTGGCRDGLHASGPNLNQGAESTLSWLIALLTIYRLQRESETGISAAVESESDGNESQGKDDAVP